MIEALFLLIAAPWDIPDCDRVLAETGNQAAMNECARRDLFVAEAEMEFQLRLTTEMMKERDEAWDDSFDDGRKSSVDTLLEGQRAWLSYRDMHCQLAGYEARVGSLEPILVAGCKTALTRERKAQLRELTITF